MVLGERRVGGHDDSSSHPEGAFMAPDRPDGFSEPGWGRLTPFRQPRTPDAIAGPPIGSSPCRGNRSASCGNPVGHPVHGQPVGAVADRYPSRLAGVQLQPVTDRRRPLDSHYDVRTVPLPDLNL